MAVQGTWFGGQGIFQDRGYTEALASMIRGLNNPGFVNPKIANTPAGQSLGLSTQPYAQTQGQVAGATTSQNQSYGSNQSPASQKDLYGLGVTVRTPKPNTGGVIGAQPTSTGSTNNTVDTLTGLRNDAANRGQSGEDAISAAIAAKKQGLQNKIPYLQQAGDLRIQGLQQGLDQFTTTAEQEEAKRVAGLEQAATGVNEQYTGSARKTRASAKALANQLRNKFAGLGTLDSTAYRDMSIDQATEIAQSMGDLNREKAGKLTANTTEKEDLKQFYAQQRMAELQRVNLEKEKVKAEVDSTIQATLDDINMTDAEKIGRIQDYEQNLADRLASYDLKISELQDQGSKDAQELAVKMTQLQNKGYSDDYKKQQDQQKALQNAVAVVQEFTDRYGKISPEQAAQIFSQYGVDPEQATFYGQLYGNKESSKNKNSSADSELSALGL